MIYSQLGQTGITVSKIGFGGAPFSGTSMDESINMLISAYYEFGISYFDTHVDYGDSMGKMAYLVDPICSQDKRVVISSKSRSYFADEQILDHAFLSRDIFKNKLGIFFVSNIDTQENIDTLKRILPALLLYKKSGVFKSLGVTSHHLGSLKEILNGNMDIDVFLFPYNLVRRECESLFPLLKEQNKGIVLMKPFSAGEVFKKYSIEEMLDFYSDKQDWFDSLLVGTKTVRELREDMFAIKRLWGWNEKVKDDQGTRRERAEDAPPEVLTTLDSNC